MISYALFIAISQWGYGIDRCPAEAIEKAQANVPVSAKPSQLLLYRDNIVWEDEEDNLIPAEPKFPPVWQEGVTPHLVGLTDTHSIWRRRKR